MSDVDAQKRAAGEAAAALVTHGMVVGLGTGSTAAWFVRALAARKLDIVGVPTSQVTADLATSLGIRIAQLGETKTIDLTVDGADEIGPGLALIKGAGGALLREKLVWEASKSCVVIAEAVKHVKILGKFPLSIEVVAFGHTTTALRICDALAECDLGVAPMLRRRDGEPVRTDGGNLIYDAACGRIEEPAALAAALKSVTGVVDHGLFLDLADRALIGTDAGVIELEP
ncbi:ribose-5-phosphate isomerase RpiA [uncultured Phenylobacterium sp.]|uniref:ribose-5-phosphate isomerase RpiA n=1 Tax=uncultured Phenylobacterium sp. TaxID=349273 RepID=UPI0025DA2581|nr:ribose-5-phosphate isomerase RpiA [uncultured Phenylobacterium sp.]